MCFLSFLFEQSCQKFVHFFPKEPTFGFAIFFIINYSRSSSLISAFPSIILFLLLYFSPASYIACLVPCPLFPLFWHTYLKLPISLEILFRNLPDVLCKVLCKVSERYFSITDVLISIFLKILRFYCLSFSGF